MTCQLEKLQFHTTQYEGGKTWLGMQEKKEMMPNDARQNANRKDYKLKQPVK